MSATKILYALNDQFEIIIKETIPNQIKQETDKPTLRWLFQLLYGTNIVEVKINEQVHLSIECITDRI